MPNKGITATTETLTVRLPSELLSLLDRLVELKLFTSRSEAIREFCREYVDEHRQLLTGPTHGVSGPGEIGPGGDR